jgi:hypothetical protein
MKVPIGSEPSSKPGSRRRLPNRRPILTEPVSDPVTGKWHLTVGFDPDGRVREIFLDRAGRAGSPFDAVAHDACILISREILQRGCRVVDLLRNLSERPPSLLAAALTAAAALEEHNGAWIGAAYRRQLEEEILGTKTKKAAPLRQGARQTVAPPERE